MHQKPLQKQAGKFNTAHMKLHLDGLGELRHLGSLGGGHLDGGALSRWREVHLTAIHITISGHAPIRKISNSAVCGKFALIL